MYIYNVIKNIKEIIIIIQLYQKYVKYYEWGWLGVESWGIVYELYQLMKGNYYGGIVWLLVDLCGVGGYGMML